jgi:hypothetical protein
MIDRLSEILDFCKSARVRPPRYSAKVVIVYRNASRKYAIKHPDRVIARNIAKGSLKLIRRSFIIYSVKFQLMHGLVTTAIVARLFLIAFIFTSPALTGRILQERINCVS